MATYRQLLLETPFDIPTDEVNEEKALSEIIIGYHKEMEVEPPDKVTIADYGDIPLLNRINKFLLQYAEKRADGYGYTQFDKTGGLETKEAKAGMGAERSTYFLPVGSDAFSNEQRVHLQKENRYKDADLTVVKLCKKTGGAYSNWFEWDRFNNKIDNVHKKFFCPVIDSSKEILKHVQEDEGEHRLFIQMIPAKISPSAKEEAFAHTFGMDDTESSAQMCWNTIATLKETRKLSALLHGRPELIKIIANTTDENAEDVWKNIGGDQDELSPAIIQTLWFWAKLTQEQRENRVEVRHAIEKYGLDDLHWGNVGAIGKQFVIIDYSFSANKGYREMKLRLNK